MFMLVFEKETGFFHIGEIEMTRKKLARGYTTGTCAQAATKAAAWMLLTGEKVQEMQVILPNGETARFPIEEIKIEEEAVSCGVKKGQRRRSGYHQWDSVESRVERIRESAYLVEGGTGVGRVTKPGLNQPVGASAINRVQEK